MEDEWLKCGLIILIAGVGGALISLTFFKGVHIEPHKLAVLGKAGFLVLLVGSGVYYWWNKR